MRVRIYTDGACSGNPGPGGWAAVVMVQDGMVTLKGSNMATTNNRMELTAVIEGVKAIVNGGPNIPPGINVIDIHSDSAYVVNAINNKWIALWQSRGWTTQSGKEVKNQDLWQKLVTVLNEARSRGIAVNMVKVKGHNGNTFNEIADKLAVGASTEAQGVASWESKN